MRERGEAMKNYSESVNRDANLSLGGNKLQNWHTPRLRVLYVAGVDSHRADFQNKFLHFSDMLKPYTVSAISYLGLMCKMWLLSPCMSVTFHVTTRNTSLTFGVVFEPCKNSVTGFHSHLYIRVCALARACENLCICADNCESDIRFPSGSKV